jgi:hypothetical protein
MVSRRQFMGKLAAGAALVCVPGAARLSGAMDQNGVNCRTVPQGCGAEVEGERSPGAAAVQGLEMSPCWDLLRPLAAGSVVGYGWRVEGLTGVTEGSFILTLRNEVGRHQQIRLCRNDGRPEGIVYTSRFDLLVMNGGNGDLRTDEGMAQAVAHVAHVLAANEGNQLPGPGLAGLLSHRECGRFASVSADGRSL